MPELLSETNLVDLIFVGVTGFIAWHGLTFFFSYLYHDKTPAWARHYARKIIA